MPTQQNKKRVRVAGVRHANAFFFVDCEEGGRSGYLSMPQAKAWRLWQRSVVTAS